MNDDKKNKDILSEAEPMGVVMPFPGRQSLSTKTSVLVIDDDPQVLRVLLRILSPSLYRVRTAMSSDEALFVAEISRPDFILLDLHLSTPPSADGLVCLKALREAGHTQPIFILSADASIEQAHEAARMGANGYLVKCDPEKFLERLNKLLRRSVEDSVTHALPPSAAAYFETRGLNEKEIALLTELTRTSGLEPETTRPANRTDIEVEKQFQSIRERLGAKNQVDLGRIIGVLSCFAPIYERIG